MLFEKKREQQPHYIHFVELFNLFRKKEKKREVKREGFDEILPPLGGNFSCGEGKGRKVKGILRGSGLGKRRGGNPLKGKRELRFHQEL